MNNKIIANTRSLIDNNFEHYGQMRAIPLVSIGNTACEYKRMKVRGATVAFHGAEGASMENVNLSGKKTLTGRISGERSKEPPKGTV